MKRRRTSNRERERIFDRERGTCHICGLPITAGQRWEVSHEIPLALGGADDDSNMRVAHERPCHARQTAEIDLPMIARTKRKRQKFIGAFRPRSIIPGSRLSPWRKRMNGHVERRW